MQSAYLATTRVSRAHTSGKEEGATLSHTCTGLYMSDAHGMVIRSSAM